MPIMKTRLLMIIVVGVFTIFFGAYQAFAIEVNSSLCCGDPFHFSLQPSRFSTDKIEVIDGKPFFVSEKYDANPVSNETITFHGVNFTHQSYPEISNPGGFVSTTVTFEDGTKKSVSVGFTPTPIPILTERNGVFAGMMRDNDGLHLLVSVDLTKISPLKQLKSGILPSEITCTDNLQRVFRYDNSPACVKPDSVQILYKRGWSLAINTVEQIPITAYIGPTDIPSANNQFALKFYSQISKDDKENNIFFSPTSLFTAFAIVYEGTRENTATEIQQVFGFEPDDSKRRTDFIHMQKMLNPQNDQYKLALANALWLAGNFEPLPEYVDTARTFYDSKVESVDFTIKEKSLDVINKWVNDKTEGKIETIFDDLRPDTLFAITNAIYFNGTWAYQFDKENTHDADFKINSEKTVQVPMMLVRNVMFNYAQTDQMEILEMPYQGDRLSMLILLPRDDSGLQSIEKSLTTERLSEWKNNLHKKDIHVMIPKFSLSADYDLTEILPKMGVSSMFDASADFGKMTKNSDGLYIYKAVHKAFVDVNEEGTEAAAATGLAGFQSGPSMFLADHPFIFLIQDKSGQILFMGRMTNPSS